MTPEKQHIENLLSHGAIEIRAFVDDGVWSGVFNSVEAFVESAKFCIRKGMDIYNTLNPANLAITNNVKPYRKAVKDGDVSEILWIPFDMDSRKKDSTGSSDSAIAKTNEATDTLTEWLSSKGWPEPMVGFSGNGFHLLYRVGLPNNSETSAMLKTIYSGLHTKFSTEHTIFDRTVRNPSRILRLYGSVNRKGDRKTWCVGDAGMVTIEQLKTLAKELTPKRQERRWVKPGSRTGRLAQDVMSAFSTNGMYLAEIERDKHYVTCPWSHEHSKTSDKDTVLWTDNPYGTFHCSHDHCMDKKISDVALHFGIK